jgi:predicted transposase/invertase (TIGR01784 family)
MITIELPKVEALTDGTAIWSWAMLFKAKTEEELEMLKTNPELSRAVETIRHFSKDEEAWLQFEAEEKARMDYQAYIAESRAEGIAKGIATGKLEDARAMLADGVPLDKIKKYTGLPIEEIERLKGK